MLGLNSGGIELHLKNTACRFLCENHRNPNFAWQLGFLLDVKKLIAAIYTPKLIAANPKVRAFFSQKKKKVRALVSTHQKFSSYFIFKFSSYFIFKNSFFFFLVIISLNFKYINFSLSQLLRLKNNKLLNANIGKDR